MDLTLPPGDDLDLLIVGTVGSGKSATANSILERETFGSSQASASERQDSCVMGQNRFDGRQVTIVETPGLDFSQQDERNFYQDAFHLCPDGFHAILIVLPFQLVKVTKKDLDEVDMIFKIVGDVWLRKYGVLVIIGGDNLTGSKSDKDTFCKWCQSQKKKLKKIFERCENRCVLFDNTSMQEATLKHQRFELVKLVDGIGARGGPLLLQDFKLVLIGKCGHGKSATGNSILGEDVFPVSDNYESITCKCDVKWANIDGRDITVVDTPGLQMFDEAAYMQAKKLYEKIFCNVPGVFNALLLVFIIGARMTAADQSVINFFERVFGEGVLRDYGVVVFTGGDRFDKGTRDRLMFKEWCQAQTGPMKEVIEKCQYRCVLFNNSNADESELKSQRQALFEIIVNNIESNGIGYSKQRFLRACSWKQSWTQKIGDENFKSMF